MTIRALRTASRRRIGRLLLSALLVAATLGAASGTAVAGTPSIAGRVHLRVLVLSDGSVNVTAIETQLGREGVPTTVVDLTSAARPVIDRAFLANDATHDAYFQGVVLPGVSSLSTDEMAALAEYERDYGIREVVAYAYPAAAVGMTAPSYSGVLDGSPLAVSAAGDAAGFGYLSGQLRIDDIDPTVAEVYGYLATGLTGLPDGTSYVPLITATRDGNSGSVVGVYSADGRNQMVITTAFDANQRYFLDLGHGIITWLTRGVHLGYQRNYLTVNVDDVFASDSQWSPQGHCTPGDDCYGAAATYVTADIRMQPDDVTYAVGWQRSSGVTLDMVFNGGGSDDYLSDHPAQTSDPLVTAFVDNAGSFGWINHTFSHEYLGCIQVAPPTVGELWHCATSTDYANAATVFIEPDLAFGHAQLDAASGYYFLTGSEISDQITRNRTWAQQHGITIDPSEVVTGEHSGLAISPEQPMDNPNLAPVLAADQIGVLASDASREATSRTIGAARTVPRHPMNVFYNVSDYLGEVSEYNWYYTSVADGGSGACEAHPDITQCITPLPDGTEAEAQTSFTSYIVPLEARTALSFVLSNDPRPFYVHQSNLTGQRLVYPVLDAIVSSYRADFDSATTPLVRLSMTQQADEMSRMTAWRSAMPAVDAYVDGAGVHVDGSGTAAAIPVTVPADATVSGLAADTYGGEQSGWIASGAASGVSIGLPTPAGGYVGVPVAPTIRTASAGNTAATITWTAGPDRGSPITGFTVRGYIGGNVTPSVTVSEPADATSATITGLTNYYPYSFTVAAESAVGSSDESPPSATVVPAPLVPGAPQLVGATAGDQAATVSWRPPADDGGSPVTLYTARVYQGDGVVSSLDVAPDVLSATFTGLTNGVGYSFDVFAYNAAGPGPASARSGVVTPQTTPPVTTTSTAATTTDPSTTATAPPTTTTAPPPTSTTTPPATTTTSTSTGTVPGTPRLTSLIAGNASVTVTWTPPTSGSTPITGYVITVYKQGTKKPVQVLTVPGTVTTLTVSNLVNGTRYQFTIQAFNAFGAGLVSSRSAPVTPRAGASSQPLVSTVAAG